MNRKEKDLVISSMIADFDASQAAFLVKVQGLSVGQVQRLKKSLFDKGGTIKVAKNTLLSLAAKNSKNASPLAPFFKEQVAVVFSNNEPVDVAKVIFDASKANEKLVIIAGSLDGRGLVKKEIEFLATLPPKHIVAAQLCGALQAPITAFASVLNQMITRLVWTLKQIEEKQKDQ